MSKIEVNEIVPQSGTTLTLGGSGDTLSIASGVSSSFPSLTVSGDLTVDTNTLYVDSTDNRVGIGTASPSGSLTIKGGTSATALQQLAFEYHSTTSKFLAIGLEDGTGNAQIMSGSGAALNFYTNSDLDTTNERMRIDTSGNVLIGKTSTTFATAGVNLQPNGRVDITRDGGLSAYFNRTTSDGNTVGFYKDGALIGSIGSSSGSAFIQGNSNSSGFYFGNSNIYPWDAGALADNTIDLGQSSYRWNDLYLGGNIYLGGTGSANALDDYETGSWTPNYSTEGGGESITYDGVTAGSYVKIGSLVFITGFIRTDAVSGGSSYLYLGGFPFTNASGNSRQGFIGIARSSAFVTHQPSALEMVSGGTKAFVKFRGTADDNSDNLLAGNLGTGTNANIILFSGSYTIS